MLFNPDPIKQTVEVCFPQKRDKENYSSLILMFSNQKHLGLVLDPKLDFNEQ